MSYSNISCGDRKSEASSQIWPFISCCLAFGVLQLQPEVVNVTEVNFELNAVLLEVCSAEHSDHVILFKGWVL